MEYVFGTVRRNGELVESLRTKGDEHTDMIDVQSVVEKYTDRIITHNFIIVEKYRSDEDIEGNCYDWYIIRNHNRYDDMFTQQIGKTEKEITDLEIENIELAQALTDAEIAIIELQEAK